MPTGYTAPVGDGTVSEFPDFALRCARAFGALVTLRDLPLDAPIPEFLPSPYPAQRLAAAEARLAALLAMTAADVTAEADKYFAEAMAAFVARVDERGTARRRYEAMLRQAEAWQPPTTEHQPLKAFMVQQLTESIAFDCSSTYDTAPEPVAPASYIADELQKARRDIARFTSERDEEQARTASRNQWVTQLRDSLSKTEGA